MTPFTAAGATQALEDAGALLTLFSNLTSKSDIPERTKLLDKVRVVRASRIQLGTVQPLKDGSDNPLKVVAEELMQRDEGLPESCKEVGHFRREKMEWDYR